MPIDDGTVMPDKLGNANTYGPIMFRFMSLPILLLLTTPVAAVITGSELELACTTALREGFKGISGQVCGWYATPCACDLATSEQERPRVCLPEGSDERTRARVVVVGIAARPELRTESAQNAADRILVERYPCAEAPATEKVPTVRNSESTRGGAVE